MIRVKKGLELEFIVVDSDLDLWPHAHEIAHAIGGKVGHEFGKYQIEISSSPSTDSAELEEEVAETIRLIAKELPSNVHLLPIGAYPFEFTPQITPNVRLKNIMTETDKRFNFRENFGVELETGLQSFQVNFSLVNSAYTPEEQVILLNRILRPTIPIIVGLTANSAFFKGRRVTDPLHFDQDGDHAVPLINGRRHIWERCEGKGSPNENIHQHGVPLEYSSFPDYQVFLSRFTGMGNPTGMESQLYVDIRPRTEDKSGRRLSDEEMRVEYRPADILPTLSENFGVMAFLEGYILASLENAIGDDIPANREELTELCKKASRNGLDASLGTTPLREIALSWIRKVKPFIDEKTAIHLEPLQKLLRKSRAEEQIEQGPRDYVFRSIAAFRESYRR